MTAICSDKLIISEDGNYNSSYLKTKSLLLLILFLCDFFGDLGPSKGLGKPPNKKTVYLGKSPKCEWVGCGGHKLLMNFIDHCFYGII